MNIAVAQSGGPTAAINSSLCGVFDEAEKYNEIDRIYGSLNGIEGILNDNLIDLKEVLITENDQAVTEAHSLDGAWLVPFQAEKQQ